MKWQKNWNMPQVTNSATDWNIFLVIQKLILMANPFLTKKVNWIK